MITLLASLILSCEDAQWIIAGIVKADGLNAQQRLELIQEIVLATDGTCSFAELPDRGVEKVKPSERQTCR